MSRPHRTWLPLSMPVTAEPKLNRQDIVAPDGARLAVYVYEPSGVTNDSPTVVFAHGWTLSHRSWLPVVRALAAQPDAPRMVLWDQRGHGESTFAAGKRTAKGQTVRALGEDLAQVLTLVPEESRIVLAGHSMGGMTVMAFAGLHKETVAERVSGVVLVSTASGELRGVGVPGEVAMMRALSKMPIRLGRAVRPRTQAHTSFGPGARFEDIADTARQIGGTRLATTGAFYSALMAHDELASLPVLNEVGTAVLCGTKDRLTPLKLNKKLAEAMPNADLHIIQGKGHMLTYEATADVVAAIRTRLAR